MRIAIRAVDLADPAHAGALVDIIDSYARGPGGQGAPLSEHARASLAAGLSGPRGRSRSSPSPTRGPSGRRCASGGSPRSPAGAAVNVHDLTVLTEYQGRGIGTRLLDEVERRARERGCCKITLEVHEANAGAGRLYERAWFGPWRPATLFVAKPL
jgi:ribosomal protein S18 acetylase RimI-like enzyme